MNHVLRSLLVDRIQRREATVGVIGLGYVGLPLALAFVRAGFRVTGFEVDARKVERLRAGRSYLQYVHDSELAEPIARGTLMATTQAEQLVGQDAILVCVPTPLTKQRAPDMRFVVEATETIARHLRPGQLVVLESTTYPGTTNELVQPLLEASGLQLDRDFLLAFSPEREDPGNASFTTRNTPKLVGGVTPTSGEVASTLYEAAVQHVVSVADARIAEAAKLTENIFRGVNIALVNELKVAFDAMGIDIWQVLDAAATKPFGFMRFDPGPGWGGHCIPIDPFYMAWKAREVDVTTRFIELAGEINVQMPEYVVCKLQRALNERGKAVKGARLMLLGVAYKPNIDDCRESPAFPILDKLARLGAELSFHDPHVACLAEAHEWPHVPQLTSVKLDAAQLRRQDAVIIVTAHRGIDYELVAENAPLVVDTRGVLRGERNNVVRA